MSRQPDLGSTVPRQRRIHPKPHPICEVPRDELVPADAALVPFLDHDGAKDARMGFTTQRQAVPLLRAEAPLVGTGMERVVPQHSAGPVVAQRGGIVESVDATRIVVKSDALEAHDEFGLGLDTYHLTKFVRSSDNTCSNQRPRVKLGDRVSKGDAIADGSATDLGELALGQNAVVAFMPWHGYVREGCALVSERLVKEDCFTSIHIEEFEIKARETSFGPEKVTRDVPNVHKNAIRALDANGIVAIGTHVKSGDILVGKARPVDVSLNAEAQLLQLIYGETPHYDTSLRVPPGVEGVVIGAKIFNREGNENTDVLPHGVNCLVKVHVATKRTLAVGDMMASRHGAARVISKILPMEDMPYLEDGTPVDVVLSPGIRTAEVNAGELLEAQLGWAARGVGLRVCRLVDEASPASELRNYLRRAFHDQSDVQAFLDGASLDQLQYFGRQLRSGIAMAAPSFAGASEDDIQALLELADLDGDGRSVLYDGCTGESFADRVPVGVLYILKLRGLAAEKIHARSIGPYSFDTQQPLGGKAQFGGQLLGEEQVWALQACGAAYTLQELQTVKSDDVANRARVNQEIVSGANILRAGMPESFNILVKGLRALALDVKYEGQEECTSKVRIGLASPERIRSWSHGEVKKAETINYQTLLPERDGLFCARIFGPVKDYECQCGRYKKRKGGGDITCERCGVDVIESKVRRERFGHIELAAPVAHIWFVSRIGTLLAADQYMRASIREAIEETVVGWNAAAGELSLEDLEKVLYCESYMITDPGETDLFAGQVLAEEDYLQRVLDDGFGAFEYGMGGEVVRDRLRDMTARTLGWYLRRENRRTKSKAVRRKLLKWLKVVDAFTMPVVHVALHLLDSTLLATVAEAFDSPYLRVYNLANEADVQEMQAALGGGHTVAGESFAVRGEQIVVVTDTQEGARAARSAGATGDIVTFEAERAMGDGSSFPLNPDERRRPVSLPLNEVRTVGLVDRVFAFGEPPTNHAEYMMVEVVPVIPPDLRPLVPLDGGRFATSDLNHLYRRVIDCNNRLRRLLNFNALEINIRREKRVLQEAVDALFDNGRRGEMFIGPNKRLLRSLTGMLKGEHGHFRQNLRGKRVDFSGRGVIVVGPELQLHQCGLPQRMALELFKPFIYAELKKRGLVTTTKRAKQWVENKQDEVCDILREVVAGRRVLVCSDWPGAPPRVMSFSVVLTDENAVRLHPAAAAMLGASFGGQEVVVHLPLSEVAQTEANERLHPHRQIVGPMDGRAQIRLPPDAVRGCQALAAHGPEGIALAGTFPSMELLLAAHEAGALAPQDAVEVSIEGGIAGTHAPESRGRRRVRTTVGRALLWAPLRPEVPIEAVNKPLDTDQLDALIAACHRAGGPERTASVIEELSRLGSGVLTRATEAGSSSRPAPVVQHRTVSDWHAAVGDADRAQRDRDAEEKQIAEERAWLVAIAQDVVITSDCCKLNNPSISPVPAASAVLNCKAPRGVCQSCYGRDEQTREPVALGSPVGMIAALALSEVKPPFRVAAREAIEASGSQGVARLLSDGVQGLPVDPRHAAVILRQLRWQVEDTLAVDATPTEATDLLTSWLKEPLVQREQVHGFLAQAAYSDTVEALVDAACRSAEDDLSGMAAKVMLGGLICAGSGWRGSVPSDA